MIYEVHLNAAESALWPLERSIEWDRIDREASLRERHIHQMLHDAALIEGYLPVYAARLLQMLRDDVDATAVLSVELFEGLRHYTALKRYLDLVGFQSAADAHAELAAARARTDNAQYTAARVPEHLTHFMGSELFASWFFLRIAEETREPVLSDLLKRMSADELRHAAAAGALLEARVRRDPSIAQQVLAAAESFRHYGSDIVEVPVSNPNDFEAIAAFNRKVRLICGAAV
jgi:rubrerythrin